MPRTRISIEEFLGILRETPSRLDALAEGLAAPQLRTAPEPGPGRRTMSSRPSAPARTCGAPEGMARIIAEGHPTIKAVNPRAWIKQTDYPDLDYRDSLRAFTAQRAQLLELLEPLAPETWSRAATITGAGPRFERTLHDYGRLDGGPRARPCQAGAADRRGRARVADRLWRLATHSSTEEVL